MLLICVNSQCKVAKFCASFCHCSSSMLVASLVPMIEGIECRKEQSVKATQVILQCRFGLMTSSHQVYYKLSVIKTDYIAKIGEFYDSKNVGIK